MSAGGEIDRTAHGASGSRPGAHILFASIPEHGHINPTLPIVAELVRRGHRVTYPATKDFAPRIAEAGATPLAYRSTLPSFATPSAWPTDLAAGLALFLDEAVAVVPWLLAALDGDRPDVVVHDTAAHGARILGHRWHVPSLALSPTHAPPVTFERDLGRLYAQNEDWIAYRARLRSFRTAHGVSLVDDEFPGPPERCVVMIPREFQLRPRTVGDHCVFVGPCIRAGDSHVSWEPPAPDRKVLYISLGTCYAERPDFYRACIDAFAGLEPWHLVIALGDQDPAAIGELPANVELHRSVPQLEVLARAAAFVTHAGMGSVLEALTYGVPMVGVPQAVDQPMNARQIAKLGLGTWISPARATPEALREAVVSVSSAAAITDGLERMRLVIAASGGAPAAADLIEQSIV